ncbi:MAG: AAA family ATPase [Chlamydiia bacterium]|nr:AAA family ATPase [Chlamydiia bacterium]
MSLDCELAIASRMLPKNASEEALKLVSFLLAAMQRGHLCVRLRPDLYPILEGYEGFSCGGLEEIISHPEFEFVEGRLYLKRLYNLEIAFERESERLFSTTPSLKFDRDLLRSQIFLLVSEKSLLKEQGECIFQAFESGLTLITGGPGTGKTYTAGHLLKLMLAHAPGIKVALAAPTGKAARNLQNSINSALEGNQAAFEAVTLHRLLGISPQNQSPLPRPLNFDVILVDESSMIDIEVMTLLFASVKDGARLILLGDMHQLPPVEAGSLFSDLLHKWEAMKRPIGRLTHCLRSDLKEIVDFSRAVNSGEPGKFGGAVSRLNLNLDSYKDAEALVKLAANHFESEAPGRFCLLTPLVKGPFGTSSLNQRIHEELLARRSEHIPVPIIVKKSSPDFGLFNGDCGILLGDKLYFDERAVPALLVEYDFGYALSVHRSQGSEYDHVLLILPEGSQQFGREVLYTGVTRAKKKLSLACTDLMFSEVISKTAERLSKNTPAQLVRVL